MKSTAAFSLIEVMCAIALLGFALVGLTRGVTTALKSSKESELHTAAALIATGQIEILRAEGYVIEGVTESDPTSSSRFQWIQNVKESAISGLYEVDVRVEMASSGESIYELKTMLFDPPLELLDESTREEKEEEDRRRRSLQ